MGKKIPPLDADNPLFVGAVASHEMYVAYVQAGFTRDEALQLVASVVAATIVAQRGDADGSED